MKKHLLPFALFFITAGTAAQEKYTVAEIKGIVLRTDSSRLKAGVQLSLKDTIIFTSKEAVVILLHPKKGRYIMKGQDAQKKNNTAFILILKDLELYSKRVRASSHMFR